MEAWIARACGERGEIGGREGRKGGGGGKEGRGLIAFCPMLFAAVKVIFFADSLRYWHETRGKRELSFLRKILAAKHQPLTCVDGVGFYVGSRQD